MIKKAMRARRWNYAPAGSFRHRLWIVFNPSTCHSSPGRNSGGYSHWHCQLKKRHEGKHRFNSYTWIGRDFKVEYEPAQ